LNSSFILLSQAIFNYLAPLLFSTIHVTKDGWFIPLVYGYES
jgi:hypothetical protein